MASVIFPMQYWKGGSCNFFNYPEELEKEILDYFSTLGIKLEKSDSPIFGQCFVTLDPVEFVPCDENGDMTFGQWDHIEIEF